MNIVYKINSDVILESFGDGTGAFYCPSENNIISLNSTAYYIASIIDGYRSLEDIQSEFYNVLDKKDLIYTENEINNMCKDTVESFVQHGLCYKEEKL